MDEQEIADKLKGNVSPPYKTDLAPITTADPVGEARIEPKYELDELVQYKLHDYFGDPYKANDEIARQQLSYIYDEVANSLPEKEYGFVVAKIRELERMIGTTTTEDRRYKLYQWLKLNNVRRNIDAQMGAING